MKTSKILQCSMGLAATGSILLAAQAKADLTLPYTVDYSSINSLAGPTTTEVSVPSFSPSLGTLTGITIALNTSDTIDAHVLNSDGVVESYSSATASAPIQITALPSSLTSTATGTASYGSGTVPAGNPESIPPSYGYASLPGASTTASSTLDVPSADFDLYEGGGDYNLTINTGIFNITGTGSSYLNFGGDATSTGNVEVTYDYVAAPEPSALLGGFGILGSMAAMAWRKRKQ